MSVAADGVVTVVSDTATAETRRPSQLTRGSGRAPRRRRWALVGVLVVGLVAAAMVFAVANPLAGGSRTPAGVIDNADPTSLAQITEQTFSSQTAVDATLGYAHTYSVVNEDQGTITALPSVGAVVGQGQVLYQVSGNPVVLLYGATPAYRTLSEGASATDVFGPDVQELNADLVALGYATAEELSPTSDRFSWRTKDALEKLQAHLGVTQNGTLALGQAVFLPSAARVTAVSTTLGAPAPPGQAVLTATSTTRQVTVALDAAQQSEVKVGDKVAITLPNNQTTPGVVSGVGTVATAPPPGSTNTTPTIAVAVTPTDPAATGSLDQAPVHVSITTASVSNALAVPVVALLALGEGGYAIEEISPAGLHHLVPVTLGLFDDADGLVQVSGSNIAAGQHVVVPAL